MELSAISQTRRMVLVSIFLIGSTASAVAAVAGLTAYVTGLTLDFILLTDHGSNTRPGDKSRTECSGDSRSMIVLHESNSGR